MVAEPSPGSKLVQLPCLLPISIPRPTASGGTAPTSILIVRPRRSSLLAPATCMTTPPSLLASAPVNGLLAPPLSALPLPDSFSERMRQHFPSHPIPASVIHWL